MEHRVCYDAAFRDPAECRMSWSRYTELNALADCAHPSTCDAVASYERPAVLAHEDADRFLPSRQLYKYWARHVDVYEAGFRVRRCAIRVRWIRRTRSRWGLE